MEPPFKKKTLAVTIDLVFARTQSLLVPVVASQQKIRKQGPFKLTGLRQEHHYFCHVLGGLLELIPELPDFSDDNKIAVMSDYGGEHSDARYRGEHRIRKKSGAKPLHSLLRNPNGRNCPSSLFRL